LKGNKIGVIFIVSAIALAGIGASYAMWSDTITMNGTVTTGTFNVDWSLGEMGDNEAQGKDFSHVEATISGNTLTVTIVNAYPCITYWVDFDVHNIGTIAAHFGDFVVDPISWHGQIVNIIPQPGYDPILDVQLHPGVSWLGQLTFHFTNTDGFQQGATYTFTVSLLAYQYNECNPPEGKVLNLPPYPDVIVNAVFTNTVNPSYWLTTLSNVPAGYDVTNGNYFGWCVDEDSWIYPGNTYTINLMSSYDPMNPWPGNYLYSWPCVNYILNHKGTATGMQIQEAIWYFLNHGYTGSDPVVLMLIAQAVNFGQNFHPGTGQVMAILCIGNPDTQYNLPVQKTIIEVDP